MAAQEGTNSSPGYTRVIPAPINGLFGECKVTASVLSRIGDKWTVFVIGLLTNGPMRFSDIKRRIGGISQRMLTLTLRGLERDGLVTRTIYPTVPPKVEYALTPLGRSLVEPIRVLAAWAQVHLDDISASRQAYDAAEARGELPPGVSIHANAA